MSMINDLTGNAKEFASACYENSIEELKQALVDGADETDCEQWNITTGEWKKAVETALSEKLAEHE